MELLSSLLLGLPAFLALIAAGYALGIVGNVGGPLFVLILLTVDQLPTMTAIGTAMFVSCLISLFASVGHWRRENIAVNYALVTGGAGAIGCFFGAFLAQRVPARALGPLLGLVVLFIPLIGLVRLARRARRTPVAAAPAAPPMLPPHQELVGGATGMIVGFFCGAFGLGGATPIAALSRMLLHQPMRLSIGAGYLAALCISLVGTAFYAVKGQIDFGSAALLSIACGFGVFLSTRAVSRIPDQILEALMLTTMVAMALFTLFHSWGRL
jgi:uncharacterized membrane protein YfcA